MKALSIRRPWPWAILHLGKRLENRTWYCHYRGPILLHTAKGCTGEEYDEAEEWMYRNSLVGDMRATASGLKLPDLWLPELPEMECAGIGMRTEIVDCFRPGNGADFKRAKMMGFDVRWWNHDECCAIAFGEVTAIPFTPWRGDRGLFEVDETQLRAA